MRESVLEVSLERLVSIRIVYDSFSVELSFFKLTSINDMFLVIENAFRTCACGIGILNGHCVERKGRRILFDPLLEIVGVGERVFGGICIDGKWGVQRGMNEVSGLVGVMGGFVRVCGYGCIISCGYGYVIVHSHVLILVSRS